MSNIFHVIKDPVHGAMQFAELEDNWIKPFIDSENFQRLRYISQVGLADWVFPGAVHNRFSHGLGSCYIASQICNKLGLEDEEKQIVILAGLLHDIGHGPFSHTFEAIFHEGHLHHEEWTRAFLQEYAEDEFLSHFNQRNNEYPLSPQKMELIRKLIMHEKTEKKLLADIVSSQLDADRLDYLLRDSHFCGVTYGQYDFRWLLHCLAIIEKDEEIRLGITSKGIGVVEQYLMARRLMMKNVYQNAKKYGAEYLLQKFLMYLADGFTETTIFSNFKNSPLIQFLEGVKKYNQQIDKNENVEGINKNFISTYYPLYKQLCDYDVFLMIRALSHRQGSHPAITIAKRLHARKLPKVFQIQNEHIQQVENIVKDLKNKWKNDIDDWQITIIKLPHLSYKMHEDPILIKGPSGGIKYLHDDSLMIGAISDKSEMGYLVSIDDAIMKSDKGAVVIKYLQDF